MLFTASDTPHFPSLQWYKAGIPPGKARCGKGLTWICPPMSIKNPPTPVTSLLAEAKIILPERLSGQAEHVLQLIKLVDELSNVHQDLEVSTVINDHIASPAAR